MIMYMRSKEKIKKINKKKKKEILKNFQKLICQLQLQ